MPVIDVSWPKAWRDQHVVLSKLRDMMHMKYHKMMGVLVREDTQIFRIPFGSKRCHYVAQWVAEDLAARYGNPAARERRLRRVCAKRRGTPLWMPCPHCGAREKQWKHGFNSAGNR